MRTVVIQIPNLENHDHPTRSVWHQYNEKTKEEFKEDASRRHYNHFPNSKIENCNSPNKSVWSQNSGRSEVSKEDRSRIQSSMEQKVPMRKFNSKRRAQNIKYVKKPKIMDNSLSEAFLLSKPPSNFVRRSPIP